MSNEAITLYWGSGSPFAWRVQLALAIKRVPYDSRLLEFSKGDTQSEAFRRLNPRGKVPVLVDGDFVVSESLAILAYLERRFPEPALFGTTAQEHGRIWQRVFEIDNHARPALSGLINPLFSGKVDREAMPAAQATLNEELEKVAAWLDEGPWLAGERVTAVDLMAYPGVMTIERALGKPAAAEHGIAMPDAAWWTALLKWRDRMAALPGVAETYPPHWR